MQFLRLFFYVGDFLGSVLPQHVAKTYSKPIPRIDRGDQQRQIRQFFLGEMRAHLGIHLVGDVIKRQQLLLEGFLESRVGAGTTVARHPPSLLGPGQRRPLPQHLTEGQKQQTLHILAPSAKCSFPPCA